MAGVAGRGLVCGDEVEESSELLCNLFSGRRPASEGVRGGAVREREGRLAGGICEDGVGMWKL